MVVKMDIKKRMKGEHGLTLIEILIGIVITALMMGAMYTSYNVVNKTYNQVSDKAKISKTSRDLVSMLMRDIRMAGYSLWSKQYFSGWNGNYEFCKTRYDALRCDPVCHNYWCRVIRD